MSLVKTDRAGLGAPIAAPKNPNKSAKELEREKILEKTRERYELSTVKK